MRVLAFLLALAWPLAAGAQGDPAETARAAIAALEQARESLKAAESARDRVAALSETVRAYEAGLEAMREGLRRATIREAAIRGVFEARRGELVQLIGMLQAMGGAPAPLTLLHPDGPDAAAHAAMIVSDVVPALRHEVEAVRATLEEVALLRQVQAGALEVLEEGLAGAQKARAELSAAISERRDLPRRFAADPDRIRALLNATETLAAFADGLMELTPETQAAVPQAGLEFAARKGQLALPVLGRLLRRYDEADAAGIRRPGLILATRPLALVTLPAPATLRYGGPLLDYGQVAIVEPQEGYLLILAGMAQVFGEVGQVLPEGAPIGMMGGAAPDSQAFLIQSRQGSDTGHSETLYIELRQNGAPVDPAEWFAVQALNKE